jgi:hypothetical protein
VEVAEGPSGPRLLIQGPGAASQACDFQDADALERYQDNYQRDLLENGFRLQATAERRALQPTSQRERQADRRRR